MQYRFYTGRIKQMLMMGGMPSGAAGQFSVGYAYQQMVRQASMLSYQNAFAILAGVIFLLSPLVFIMRLPPKRQAPPPEEAMGH